MGRLSASDLAALTGTARSRASTPGWSARQRAGRSWTTASPATDVRQRRAHQRAAAARRRRRHAVRGHVGHLPRPGARGAGPVPTRGARPRPLVDLSTTQRRVLEALCRPYQGGSVFANPLTDEEFAEELFLSPGAVRTHMAVMVAKFGLDDIPADQQAGPPGRAGDPVGNRLDRCSLQAPPSPATRSRPSWARAGSASSTAPVSSASTARSRSSWSSPRSRRDPVIRERLRRETRTVAALDHPNIAPLYEAGRGGRDGLHRHPLGGGNRAGGADPAREPRRRGAGGALRGADRRRAGAGPREGARPPRRQAHQRDRHRRGPRVPDRLRPGQAGGVGVGPDRGQPDARDGGLRGPGGDRGQRARGPRRRLRARLPWSTRSWWARLRSRARRAGWPRCGPS